MSGELQCKQDIREGDIQVLNYDHHHKKQVRASQELGGAGCETQRDLLCLAEQQGGQTFHWTNQTAKEDSGLPNQFLEKDLSK